MKTIFSFLMMMLLMVGASFAGSASPNMPTQSSVSSAIPTNSAKEENGMSKREQRKALKEAVKQIKSEKPSAEISKGLLIVLAILIPFLAVGLYTDWDLKKVIIALVLEFLFVIPAIVYALLVINDKL